MDILVTVEGQKMKLSANQKNHIEGSQKFVKFKFDFSSEWTKLKKTAWFIQGNKALPAITSEISEQTGTVYLPNEIKKGQCKMALRGVDPEDGSNVTATTNYILLEIGEDVTQAKGTASDPDSMALFDTKIKALLNATNETTAAAALGAAVAATVGINLEEISGKVAQSVNKSTDEAKGYAADAAKSATEARESAKSVSEAVEAAQDALEKASALERASNEIIGKNGTADSPAEESALKEIRDIRKEITDAESETIKARNEILGSDNGRGYKTDLDEIRNDAISAKQQIVGSSGSAAQPDTGSALEKVLTVKELIVGKDGTSGIGKEVKNAKNYIIGEDSGSNVYTYVSPADKSALKEIRLAKKYIVGAGDDNTSENPADDSALKKVQNSEDAASASASSASSSAGAAATSVTKAQSSEDNAKKSETNVLNAKKEIIGESGTATNPTTTSALGQIKSAKNDIIGKDGTATSPTTTSALGQIKSTKKEIIGESGTADSPATTSALGQIKSAKNEIFGAGGTSVKPIVGSALEDMREARKQIVGVNHTSTEPAVDSALAKALKAAKDAEASAVAAANSATSANKGITVINNLEDTSTANALSAAQGKWLNDNKLDISGGTMTGDLILKGNPTSDNMAATKKYVDDNTPTVPQPDYNQNNSSEPDYIKNRPCYSTSSKVNITIAEGIKIEDNVNQQLITNLTERINIGDAITIYLNDIKINSWICEEYYYLYYHNFTENNKIGFVFRKDEIQLYLDAYNRTEGDTLKFVKTQKMFTTKLDKHLVEAEDYIYFSSESPVSGVAVYNYCLPKKGGTLTGNLYLKGDPTSRYMAATKKYVDEHIPSISEATTSASGLMSKSDKEKLDGIDKGANNYELPAASKTLLGGVKVGTNLSITDDGVLSADAQKMTVDTTITEGSENAVSSGAVFARIGNLKFVVANEVPSVNDPNVITLVL